MYQLKKGKEAFTVVEGQFKGVTFKPGTSYSEIPSAMAGSFTRLGTDLKSAPTEAAAAAVKPLAEVEKPAKADNKK